MRLIGKVDSDGNVIIPDEVVEALGLALGDELNIQSEGSAIILSKKKETKMDNKKIFKLPTEAGRKEVSIEPNYQSWDYDKRNRDMIYVRGDKYDGINGLENISFTLETAKFIRDSLNEIIGYYEELEQEEQDKRPTYGDYVKIINGRFTGCFGVILQVCSFDYDYPKKDNDTDLIIDINDSDEFEGCTCYLDYDDVEKCATDGIVIK